MEKNKKNNKSKNVEENKDIIVESTEEVKEETKDVEDTVSEVKVEIVREKKESDFVKWIKENRVKVVIAVVVLVLVIGIVSFIIKFFKSDDIKRVSKVLPAKYYAVDCLTNSCDGIAAYKGNKLAKSKVTILNGDGKVIAKYKDVYDPKAKISKEPINVGENYFIYKKINNSTNKVVGYSIAGKNGKETYTTEKVLKVLNNKLVLMNDTNKGINSYSILTPRGKVLFKNMNDYTLFNDGKIISAEIEGTKQILDENGKTVLSDYFVATSVKNEEDEVLYLLVEDSKNNSYNYFDIKSLKIVGDSFQNYTKNGDGTLTITKKENNTTVKYLLNAKGKQKLIGDGKTQAEIANELRKTIDENKYNLYLTSIYDKDQKYVFADDIVNKTFGIYNIKTNKYKKIYGYKSDASNLYSSIAKITNENDLDYYQISCSTYNCNKNEFYVFDLANGKALYKQSDTALKIQNYYQYEDGYKVVKYSYSTTNEEYKGKYVLYDAKNKEVTKSNNNIVVVDRKQLIGYESSSSLILFSARYKKVLNTDKNLGAKLTLAGKKYYRYQTKDNTILVNEKGKEVLKIDSASDIIYSDKLLVFIKNKKINIFDASKGKIKKYRLKNNEKMNDASGDLIAPYRGALFINNTADNHIKVLNSKGNVIKSIRKVEIQSVHKNKDGNVVIITRNDTGKGQTFGLYIAK